MNNQENKSLIEYNQSLMALFDEIEDWHEENPDSETLPSELAERYQELQVGFEQKVDRCVGFLKYADSVVEYLKEEKRALDVAIKRTESAQKRMKDLAGYLMRESGVRSIKGQKRSFYSRITRSVEIADVDLVPDEMCRFEKKPVKAQIKAKLEAGESVDGCMLVEKESISAR